MRIAKSVLLLATFVVLFPAVSSAQPPATVSGEGSVTVKPGPSAMRLTLRINASGETPEEALKKLGIWRDNLLEHFRETDPAPRSVSVGKPLVQKMPEECYPGPPIPSGSVSPSPYSPPSMSSPHSSPALPAPSSPPPTFAAPSHEANFRGPSACTTFAAPASGVTMTPWLVANPSAYRSCIIIAADWPLSTSDPEQLWVEAFAMQKKIDKALSLAKSDNQPKPIEISSSNPGSPSLVTALVSAMLGAGNSDPVPNSNPVPSGDPMPIFIPAEDDETPAWSSAPDEPGPLHSATIGLGTLVSPPTNPNAAGSLKPSFSYVARLPEKHRKEAMKKAFAHAKAEAAAVAEAAGYELGPLLRLDPMVHKASNHWPSEPITYYYPTPIAPLQPRASVPQNEVVTSIPFAGNFSVNVRVSFELGKELGIEP